MADFAVHSQARNVARNRKASRLQDNRIRVSRRTRQQAPKRPFSVDGYLKAR